jgi:O-antigen/teichoic acid export membrane protein
MAVLVLAIAARQLGAAAAQGLSDFVSQLRASFLGAWVLPAGALAIFLGRPASGGLGGASLALLLTALHFGVGAFLLLGGPVARAKGGEPLPEPERARFWRYARGVGLLLALDAVVWQQSEALFLEALSTDEELGRYTVSHHLVTQAMQLLPGSLGVALFPALARLVGQGDAAGLKKAFVRSVGLLAALSIPIAIVGSLLAEPFLRLALGEEYLPAAPTFRVLLGGGAAGAIAIAASSLLYAQERQAILIRVGLLAAALNLVLDGLLIGPHGALGAAIANSSAQGLAALVTVAIAARGALARSPA